MSSIQMLLALTLLVNVLKGEAASLFFWSLITNQGTKEEPLKVW